MALGVSLGRFVRVMHGVMMMAAGGLRMMGGKVMIAGLVVFGGFAVVAGGVVVVFSGFIVMFGCLYRHGRTPWIASSRGSAGRERVGSSVDVKQR